MLRNATAEWIVSEDHYAALGLSPNCEDVVIRAAYLALMRRYHPDCNPSAAAAARARTITAAYEVLGNAAQRECYDWRDGFGHPARIHETVRPQRTTRMFMMLASAAVILSLAMLFAIALPQFREAATPTRHVLSPLTPAAQAQDGFGESCFSGPTTSLINRELFRRAARLRGSDRAFEQIGTIPLVRVEEVVSQAAEGGNTVRCTASIVLDLSPGLTVTGGSRSLRARVSYALSTIDGHSTLANLANVGLIVEKLATLKERTAPNNTADVEAVFNLGEQNSMRSAEQPSVSPSVRRARAEVSPPARQLKAASECSLVKNRIAAAMCQDPNLAMANQQLASLLNQSFRSSDAATQALLLQGSERFRTGLEACSSADCMREVFRDRTREIINILGRRPRPAP